MGLAGFRLNGCIWCLNGIRLSRRIGRPLAGKFRTVLGGLLRLDLRTATTHFSLSDRDASGTLILLQSLSGVTRGRRVAALPSTGLIENWIHLGIQGPRVAAIISIVQTCRRLENLSSRLLASVLSGLAGFPMQHIP